MKTKSNRASKNPEKGAATGQQGRDYALKHQNAGDQGNGMNVVRLATDFQQVPK